jgi:predicted RNase H-like nuclease (RuvC/YqgF family)
MTEYKEILGAIENLLIDRKDKLTHLWELNNSYFREIKELKKENKQLRDDLCELSREYTKNNKI